MIKSEIINFDKINDNIKNKTFVINTKRMSLPRMTKYEVTRLIGNRAEQLKISGCQSFVNYDINIHGNHSYDIYINMAIHELLLNYSPMIIKRIFLQNGEYELWYPHELDKSIIIETYPSIKKIKKLLDMLGQ